MIVRYKQKTKKVFVKNTRFGGVYKLGDSYYLRVTHRTWSEEFSEYTFLFLRNREGNKEVTNDVPWLDTLHEDSELEEIGELRCEIVEK